MLLEQFVADVDRICDADPAAFADMESIKVLRRQLARLDAAATRATAAFDGSGEWKESGARSLSSWLAHACNLPITETRRQISNGRALRYMPLAEEAWLAGDISTSHVGVLAGAWLGAAVGAAAKLVGFDRPRVRSAGGAMYLVLGWLAIVATPELLRRLDVTDLALIAASGVLFTLGSAVLASRRPDPWPVYFGYHEVWHGMVIVASVLDFIVIWHVI